MKGTLRHGPRNIRFEDRTGPAIARPTDAILRLAATCIGGSDHWPHRSIQPIAQPSAMGHEYCSLVEGAGKEVKDFRRGQCVVGSFAASRNACGIYRHGNQAPCLRVPIADGSLVAADELPSGNLISSLLAVSALLGTAWLGAEATNGKPGSTVVLGDGAVGRLSRPSTKRMGAKRIIAMSRQESRQKPAKGFDPPGIGTGLGDDSVARRLEVPEEAGAGYVEGPHGVECKGEERFYAHVPIHSGPAPARH